MTEQNCDLGHVPGTPGDKSDALGFGSARCRVCGDEVTLPLERWRRLVYWFFVLAWVFMGVVLTTVGATGNSYLGIFLILAWPGAVLFKDWSARRAVRR